MQTLFVLLLIASQDVSSVGELLEQTTPFAIEEPASRGELRRVDRDLRERVESDRQLRERYAALLSQPSRRAPEPQLGALEDQITALEQDNTAALKGYVTAYGWFPRSVWNWRPGWNAWLIVQHADDDPEFQARVLATMKPLVDRGEIGIKNYAYLYDRVARNHDLPQRYGTQGRCIGPNAWEPLPTEEPERVTELRNDAGLEPLGDYARYEAERCQGPEQ